MLGQQVGYYGIYMRGPSSNFTCFQIVKSRSNPDLSTCYTSTRTVYARTVIDHPLAKEQAKHTGMNKVNNLLLLKKSYCFKENKNNKK